jgi:hypothetical protein
VREHEDTGALEGFSDRVGPGGGVAVHIAADPAAEAKGQRR